jgi:hypothetical protein
MLLHRDTRAILMKSIQFTEAVVEPAASNRPLGKQVMEFMASHGNTLVTEVVLKAAAENGVAGGIDGVN